MHKSGGSGIFEDFTVDVPVTNISAKWEKVRAAGPAEAVKMGKYNAMAPTDQDFARAAEWQVQLPDKMPENCSDLFLQVRYVGDVGRIIRGTCWIDDDFYHGEAWEIGLKRFMEKGKSTSLDLKILPLRKDAPIFLEPKAQPNFAGWVEVMQVEEIEIVPEYERPRCGDDERAVMWRMSTGREQPAKQMLDICFLQE